MFLMLAQMGRRNDDYGIRGGERMKVIETPIFSRQLAELLSEQAYDRLLAILALNPEYGLPLPGGEGLRRTRWDERGDSENGGIKILYGWDEDRQELYMLVACNKEQQDNMSNDQRKNLRASLKGIVGDAPQTIQRITR